MTKLITEIKDAANKIIEKQYSFKSCVTGMDKERMRTFDFVHSHNKTPYIDVSKANYIELCDPKNILALIEAYEKLEADVERHKLGELMIANSYQDELQSLKDKVSEERGYNTEILIERDKLKSENQKYRAALEFYADQDNWHGYDNETCILEDDTYLNDYKIQLGQKSHGGKRAREALKEGEK
jgi:hypothetical protein